MDELASKAENAANRGEQAKVYKITRMASLKRLFNFSKAFKAVTCCVKGGDIRFEVQAGIRQDCVTSALLFNLDIDWVMLHSTEDQPRGVWCTLFSSLEDLDFADDKGLLSHTHCRKQEKTSTLST